MLCRCSVLIANHHPVVEFCDQDTPEFPPVYCYTEWKVGLTPPNEVNPVRCESENSGVSFWFPSGTYSGVANLTISLSHTYKDDRYVLGALGHRAS